MPTKKAAAAEAKKNAPEPRLTKSFVSEYERLNSEQKKAVDTVEGPVMVIAGPGTGKTQVLAMRVANILKKTHARPGNILCLTFSTSGATAMRERLRTLIGPDAYGVTVSTIHGFCQTIIDHHPNTFQEWSMGTQITDVQRYQEMNKIVDQVSSQSELISQKDPYGKNASLLERISQVKREGKTFEDLLVAAKEFDEEMKGKSREGTKAHAENLQKARKFREFAAIFKLYQEMLLKSNRYDYDDMILTVLKALKQEDWLLASLQERFQYILLDEAQDLNGAQWQVVELLTTYESLPHEPNLFLVGDDDQSIYRFQGANLLNMVSFHTRFPKAPTIVLTQNYRSTQTILDAAERLIEKNEERLVNSIKGLTKHLTAFTKEKGTEPTLLRPASDASEPWLVADLVEERLKKLPAKEIAVITQTNSELFALYDVLRARSIPVILRGKADLLAQPVVEQAVAILSALEHLKSDNALSSALSCDCFGCHPADIARLASASRSDKKTILDVSLSIEANALSYTNAEALLKARDIILDLSNKRLQRTVLETIEHTLRESSLSVASKDPLELAAIEAFFHLTKQWCFDHPCLEFSAFLKDLQIYADPEYGAVRLTYQIPHLVSEGVQLMTAHQSKGLEFHTVIITNFRDGHWDKRRSISQVSIPEHILYGWSKEQKAFEKGQDERRIAYVAMTRAKRELLFTCPKELAAGEKARDISPSAFFAEAGPLPEETADIKNPEKASLLFYTPVRDLDEEMKAYIAERLKTFALSPTSLGRFLRDPQEFLHVDLLQQPEEFTESKIRSVGYGSAVHWALKQWAGATGPFTEKDLLKEFAWHLKERSILTEKQREDLQSIAATALPRYFEQKLQGAKPVIHAIEREYRAHLKDIPLKGRIDRIDRASETSADAVVIDYKAGKAKTEREIRGGIEPGQISRTDEGGHFRQLVFYALLLEQGDPLLKPQVFALDYLGEKGEDPKRMGFEVTEAEKKDLVDVITAVWVKILAMDFSSL